MTTSGILLEFVGLHDAETPSNTISFYTLYKGELFISGDRKSISCPCGSCAWWPYHGEVLWCRHTVKQWHPASLAYGTQHHVLHFCDTSRASTEYAAHYDARRNCLDASHAAGSYGADDKPSTTMVSARIIQP